MLFFRPFSLKSKTSNSYYVHIGAVIFFGILFWAGLQLSDPLYFLYDDNANYGLVSLKYIWLSMVEHQQIPMYDFYQSSGEKFLGQSVTGFFHPFSYIAVPLSLLFTNDFYWSFDFFMLLNILLSGIGMYVLLRYLHVKSLFCLLGSFIWITTPYYILVSKIWYAVGNIISFMPIYFFSIFFFIRNPSFKSFLLCSILKAIAFYIGHPQFVMILLLSECIFFSMYLGIPLIQKLHARKTPSIIQSIQMKKKVIFLWISSYISSLFLIAPKLLTVYENVSLSFTRKGDLPLHEILAMSSGLTMKWSTFFQSQIFANVLRDHAIYNASIPILSLFFISFVIGYLFLAEKLRSTWRKSEMIDKRKVLILGILTVPLVLIVANFLFTQFAPSTPTGIFHPLLIFLSLIIIVCALGWKCILTQSGEKAILYYSLLVSSFIFLLLSSVLYVLIVHFPVISQFRWPFKHYPFFLFFLILLFVVMAQHLYEKLKERKKWLPKSIAILMTLSIFLNVLFCVFSGSERDSFFRANNYLGQSKEDPYRNIIEKQKGKTYFVEHSSVCCLPGRLKSRALLFGFPLYWQYFGFGGYNPLGSILNANIDKSILQFNPEHLNIIMFSDFIKQRDHFQKWSGRYLITSHHMINREAIESLEGFSLLHDAGELLIYEDELARPIASLLETDERVPFSIQTNTAEFYPNNDQKRTLVVTFAATKGLSYRINKKGGWSEIPEQDPQSPEPIQIEIPENTEIVQLRYTDKYFLIGLWISLAYISLLIGFLLFRKRSGSRMKSPSNAASI